DGTPRGRRSAPGQGQAGGTAPGQAGGGGASGLLYSGGGGRGRVGPRRGRRPRGGGAGPGPVVGGLATTRGEAGWGGGVAGRGDLLLTRVEARPDRAGAGTAVDPVMLEIFNNLFMSVAEQMGVRLQATAHSVNVKERLDFSCAVFDADGGL